MSKHTNRPHKCSCPADRARDRLARWALLVSAAKGLERLLSAAERDGILDGLGAQNAHECLSGLVADLLESVPVG